MGDLQQIQCHYFGQTICDRINIFFHADIAILQISIRCNSAIDPYFLLPIIITSNRSIPRFHVKSYHPPLTHSHIDCSSWITCTKVSIFPIININAPRNLVRAILALPHSIITRYRVIIPYPEI